jgi:hypothetical protein
MRSVALRQLSPPKSYRHRQQPLKTPDTVSPVSHLCQAFRLWRKGVHWLQVGERFQSPRCGHLGDRSGRRGGASSRLSVERRRGCDRSRSGSCQTTRIRTRRAGKAERGWRVGARTRPHLGSAHLPGSVQEGAVIEGIREGREPRALTRRDRCRTKRSATSTSTSNSGNTLRVYPRTRSDLRSKER